MSLSCSASLSAFFTAASGALGELDGEERAETFSFLGDAEASALTAFFNSSSLLFFFSCFSRSSALVALVKAIAFPSGDHFGLPAPFGKSVNENESPPAIGKIDNCGGSGLPSFSVARTKSRYLPSGDQRGAPSCLPVVNWRGWSPPEIGTVQIEVS